MLLHAYKSRFHMPHWCGLFETPYTGVRGRSGLHSDIAQMGRASGQNLTVTGSNPVIRLTLAQA